MFYETIDLYSYFGVPRGNAAGGELTVYSPSPDTELRAKRRPAVLVIPGGGYSMVSQREDETVAHRFLAAGFSAFCLHYTVNAAYPVPLVEGAMALAFLRREREKYGIDGDKVCALGFSAGGHLAGMLATMYAEEPVRAALKGDAGLVRPDAVLLSYPVLTTDPAYTHGGTAQVISGGEEALRRALSVEKRVTADCPPVFLWHTANDGSVPVQNSLLMAEACAGAGVPFELHIFADGVHGLSCADRETSDDGTPLYNERAQGWLPLALGWLRFLGFITRTV